MTLRPDVIRALATRQRQVDRLLEQERQEVFHVGEILYCIESPCFPYKFGAIYRVCATNGQWIQLADVGTDKPIGKHPGIGSSYFKLFGVCNEHRGAWRATEPRATTLDGHALGWHYCSRCRIVLPECPNRYWMTHVPHVPNPDKEAPRAHTERSARPRAAA